MQKQRVLLLGCRGRDTGGRSKRTEGSAAFHGWGLSVPKSNDPGLPFPLLLPTPLPLPHSLTIPFLLDTSCNAFVEPN